MDVGVGVGVGVSLVEVALPGGLIPRGGGTGWSAGIEEAMD